MLRLLHQHYKGVKGMKQKLLKLSMSVGMSILFIGVVQAAFAEETVATEATEISTTQTSVSEEEVKTSDTMNSSTETTKEEIVSKSSMTKKDVDTIVEDVESFAKDKVGEKKGETIDLDKDYTASAIRKSLLETEMGITKEDLAKYSDRQLEDTMTLFLRYNYDTSGMDMSSYVRLLTALFVNNTVSLDKALAQLTFDPNKFSSFSEMIPHVKEIQTYLQVLYPPNSSFYAAKEMTDSQLTAVLEYLQTLETKMTAERTALPTGRIGLIIYHAEQGSNTDNTTDTSTTGSKNDQGTAVTSSDSTKKNDAKKDGLLKLPQTGEEKAKWAISIIGVLLIIGMIIILMRRNKVNKNS